MMDTTIVEKKSNKVISLVHDVVLDEDSPTSSKSDIETYCDIPQDNLTLVSTEKKDDLLYSPLPSWSGEKRRRKLPEIPKNKKREPGIII